MLRAFAGWPPRLAAGAGTLAASVALLNPQTNQWDFAEAFSANDGNLLTGRQEVGVDWLQRPTILSAPPRRA
jgi:hypothetical protein